MPDATHAPAAQPHFTPAGLRDTVALVMVKTLRFFADAFFAKRYGNRAVVLETIAAIPGMVAGALRHLTSLRTMREDGAWIRALLDEAENERMHLMTFVEVCRPSTFERWIVFLLQGVFWNAYFLFYLFWPRTAHRFVGYLEEEAVVSYTHYLAEIDAGRHENGPAPEIAKRYWKLPADARLRDVILYVRNDEAEHRDVNHGLANAMSRGEQPAPPNVSENHI